MAGSSTPVEVFYSYAHADAALRDELEKHLSLLRRQGVITAWHDRHILPGTDWAQAIDEHLEGAAVILLLISSDFLASDYCYGLEMQRVLERHKETIPERGPNRHMVLEGCRQMRDEISLQYSSAPVLEWFLCHSLFQEP